jgi:N-acetylneuraminate synthase
VNTAPFLTLSTSRGRRVIGAGHPTFVIAEAGVNHNGDLGRALDLVQAAADAGADAVKFQTFHTDLVVTARAPQAAYQRRNAPARSQRDMIRRLELSEDTHRRLKSRAERRGLVFLSTPFDAPSADFLFALGVPAFKIPSGELTNLPFLRQIARFRRPILLSTGMSTLAEVAVAVATLRRAGGAQMALLHCVSCYPARLEDVNLRAIETLAGRFHVPAGYSDHTLGIEASLAAVARGAVIIEKHLTLDRRLKGPDHAASLEPREFAAMVHGIRNVERMLGSGVKAPVPAELPVARVARRSLVTAVPIPRDTRITASMVMCKRPGTGLPPSEHGDVVGRTTRKTLSADHVLRRSDFA